MKRIAIELYGLTRSYNKTFDSFFFNLLQPNYKDDYIIDIFIHTWSETESSDIVWHNPTGKVKGRIIDNIIYKDLIDKYTPKAIIVDNPFDIDKNILIRGTLCNNKRSYSSLISVSYSRYKVNELRKQYEKENNIHYDWVIATRMDINFHTPFRINDYLNSYGIWQMETDKKTVYTACDPFGDNKIELGSTTLRSDIIIFSTPELMDEVCAFYQDIKEHKIDSDFILDNYICLEYLFVKYLNSKNISTTKIKYIYRKDFSIARKDEESIINQKFSTRKFKDRLDFNIQQIKQYFKPILSWISEIFSLIYYLLKIVFKIFERLRKCI